MTTETLTQAADVQSTDFLPLKGTDYIEFYVGNAKQAAYFYCTAFGFRPHAYCGPETGVKEFASYVVVQNKLRFVFTTPLQPGTEMADHIYKHGDGVKVLALWVDDANDAFEATTSRGAIPYLEPREETDSFGKVVRSGIRTYGDTVHIFVEREAYSGPFLPGYVKWESNLQTSETGLLYVDHCVGNVGWGEMNRWVDYYANALGFKQIVSFDDKDISTEYSALMSKVMSNGNGFVKFPINEPAEGKRKSQIEEYLDFYKGPGVQHIALATNDIINTVGELTRRGIEFLRVPGAYYETVTDRVGSIDEDLKILSELGILVDRDEEGYLLQIFTRPVEDRPTLFFEIIERKGAQSFGKGNFKALFEAIEAEQERRGNL